MTPGRVAPVTVPSWLSGQGGQAVPPLAPLLLSVPPPYLFDPRQDKVVSEDYGFKAYIEVRSPTSLESFVSDSLF